MFTTVHWFMIQATYSGYGTHHLWAQHTADAPAWACDFGFAKIPFLGCSHFMTAGIVPSHSLASHFNHKVYCMVVASFSSGQEAARTYRLLSVITDTRRMTMRNFWWHFHG